MEWLNGIGFLATLIMLISGALLVRKLKRLDQKSTDELREIIAKPNQAILYGPALKELENRKEDYSEVLPNLLHLSISGDKMERMFAWSAIETYFPEISDSIDYDFKKPTAESKSLLKGLIE